MPFVTVNQGGPDIEPGVYPVIVTAIADPKTVTAQRGPKAGQDIDLIDWTFAIESGPGEGTELRESTSTASGPKSKMFAWLTALLGGKPPQIGQGFEKSDLVGRLALATIAKDESGWPRISQLSAMPVGMLSQAVGTATGAPVATVAGSPVLAVPAAAATDALPF